MPYDREYDIIERLIKSNDEDVCLIMEILINYNLPKKQAQAIMKKWQGDKLSQNEKRNLKRAKAKINIWREFFNYLDKCDDDISEEMCNLRDYLIDED